MADDEDSRPVTREEMEKYQDGYKHGIEGDILRDITESGFPDKSESYTNGYNAGKDDRGGCFLTTACTQARGLPDNCLELTALRGFRDSVLMRDSDGRRAVKEYYRVAPMIVAAVNSSSESTQVWNNVYKNVRKAADLVRSGDFNAAFEHYKEMVDNLKGKFLS